MDRDKRRALIIAITVGAILIGPLAALSPWGMDELEALAVRNSSKSWAGSLQLWCADGYAWTLRRDRERQAYETYVNQEDKKTSLGDLLGAQLKGILSGSKSDNNE